MKNLYDYQMFELSGGSKLSDGLTCVGSTAATVASIAATILTGGTFGIFAILSMATTVACYVNFADGVGR